MKKLFLFLLFFFPLKVFSGELGEYHGYVAPYEMVISPFMLNNSWGELTVFTKVETETKIYNLTEECSFPLIYHRFKLDVLDFTLTCKKDGKSPLAGTIYKVNKRPQDTTCDKIEFVCVSGCNGQLVPKKFVFDPQCEG